MATNYIPFESKSGFKSPGFIVNENGDIVVDGSVQFNSQFNVAPDFTVNGVLVIDASDSVVSLGDQIKNSYLTRVGTLEFLNIEGDLRISQGSTPYFNVVDGHIEMHSFQSVGSIENMSIGLHEPADANFKSVNIGPGDSSGQLTVQGNIGVEGDITTSGDVSTGGNILLTNLPTESNHATRKDYVDSRISAFAIAFGA